MSNLQNMSWLVPLVVHAADLRGKMLGDTGEPPQPDLEDHYKNIIEGAAYRLMQLPNKREMAALTTPIDPVWIDIAYAMVAHYEGYDLD
jgi:hypothetical protein